MSRLLPLVFVLGALVPVHGQIAAGAPAPQSAATSAATILPPADYVIGPDDVLGVMFWREKDLSADVAVRPDGMITLPLINDVPAAGLTPTQLRDRITEVARRFVEEPSITVVVRQINSRRVYVMGEVMKPGPYPLTSPTTVLQMLAVAGGLREYADGERILIMRSENGRQVSYSFNYKDVSRRRNLRQNIELKPGDTIVVP